MKRVSGKQMCRVLERRGWLLVRTRGSHHGYQHPDGRMATVPVHGNKILRIKTQRRIMRQAGLKDSDL